MPVKSVFSVGFLWPVISLVTTESTALMRENTDQRTPVFWHIIHSVKYHVKQRNKTNETISLGKTGYRLSKLERHCKIPRQQYIYCNLLWLPEGLSQECQRKHIWLMPFKHIKKGVDLYQTSTWCKQAKSKNDILVHMRTTNQSRIFQNKTKNSAKQLF